MEAIVPKIRICFSKQMNLILKVNINTAGKSTYMSTVTIQSYIFSPMIALGNFKNELKILNNRLFERSENELKCLAIFRQIY